MKEENKNLGELFVVKWIIRQFGFGRTGILLASSLFLGFLDAIGLSLIAPFISLLVDPSLLERSYRLKMFLGWFDTQEYSSSLRVLGIILICLYLTKNAFSLLFRTLNFKFSYDAQHILSNRVFSTYLNKNYLFFSGKNAALLVRNVGSVTGSLVQGLLIPIVNLFSDIFLMLALLTLLVLTNWKITLVAFLLFGGVAAIVLFVLRKKVSKLGESRDHHANRLTAVLNHAIYGAKDVKVLGVEKSFIDQYESTSKRLISEELRYQLSSSINPIVMEVIGVSAIVLLILWRVESGEAPRDVFDFVTVFGLACVRLLPLFGRLPSSVFSIRFYSAALKNVWEDLADVGAPKDKETEALSKYPFNESIDFNSVSVKYPGRESLALDQISLNIKKNEFLALVGPSGGGKTTLADLIIGLIQPTSGDVSVDGKAMDTIPPRAWKSVVGYVPQTVYLVDGSISENVAFGISKEERDPVALNRAIAQSRLTEVAANLPNGIETEIGDRGMRLSGGQRQRIGIARALYRDPEVLIFDEATAALDNLTEEEIIDYLRNLRGKKTVIIIAHRLSTVRFCDRIVVIESGKVIDQGSFDQLSVKTGLFQDMLNGKRDGLLN